MSKRRKLLTISGRKALRRYYGRTLWRKAVTDYADFYYVAMTFLGAIIGIVIMGFVLL